MVQEVSTVVCIDIMMPALAVLPLQRKIIKRERACGAYRSSSAFLAKVVATIPLTMITALLYGIPIYWMVGLQPTAAKYFTFLVILVVHALSSNALGLAVGAGVPNVPIGQIVGPLIVTVLLLFGGPLVNLDQVPHVFRWMQWVSIVAYSNKALAQNEFKGLSFECQPGAVCYSDGSQALETFKLTNPGLWESTAINAAIGLGLVILGFVLFNRTSRPPSKLK
jgi:ABC-type multidrug transport system permease subunit